MYGSLRNVSSDGINRKLYIVYGLTRRRNLFWDDYIIHFHAKFNVSGAKQMLYEITDEPLQFFRGFRCGRFGKEVCMFAHFHFDKPFHN